MKSPPTPSDRALVPAVHPCIGVGPRRDRTFGGGIGGITVVVVAVMAVTVLIASGCSGGSGDGSAESTKDTVDVYSGYTVDPPSDVSDVVLPSSEPLADGSKQMKMVAEPGGLDLVYFGYTFCPDVCPTTMADLRKALAELEPAERDRLQVAMVSIDPARDSAEHLQKYVTNFVPDGVALRTDDAALLRAAADAFGANYEVKINPKGAEEVSHTGELYAVDDTGTVVMQWPFGTGYKSMARDLRSLLSKRTD